MIDSTSCQTSPLYGTEAVCMGNEAATPDAVVVTSKLNTGGQVGCVEGTVCASLAAAYASPASRVPAA